MRSSPRPALTAISDRGEARAMLLEDALRGVEIVREIDGPIVDVGSGNGSPGIPLAAALPDREVTLLDSSRRKCEFLERAARRIPEREVVWGRAEEQETERFGSGAGQGACAAAVALEWLLAARPPGRRRGAVARRVGRSERALARVRAARRARRSEERRGLAVVRKIAADSSGFPAAPRNRPETSSRLTTMAVCPAASTPSRTRKAASARRRLR